MTEYFDEETVRMAVGGCCHDFAIAVHRRTGWPIACIWLDPIRDEFSLSNEPAPLHVFCIAPNGQAVDVEGAEELDAAIARYCRCAEERSMARVEVHGAEQDWERVSLERSTAMSLRPREHGIEAADKVISDSQSFLELVRTLQSNELALSRSSVPQIVPV